MNMSIAGIVIHQNYSTHERHNDIALIRLEKPVEFSDRIRPICLPIAKNLRNKNYDDSLLTAVGFTNSQRGI